MEIYFWLCSLHPGLWLNCWALRSSFASLSLRRSWVAPPLNQAALEMKKMQHVLQIVENNQANVQNKKKSTFMQQ